MHLTGLTLSVEIGEGVPPALRKFVDYHRDHASFLRAQLGAGGSFIAWTKGQWVCQGIPASLERFLHNISHEGTYTRIKGSFITEPPTNLAFHKNGSYFGSRYSDTARGSHYHLWEFASETLRSALNKFSPTGLVACNDLDELAVGANCTANLGANTTDTL
jgi:hypothetical protein